MQFRTQGKIYEPVDFFRNSLTFDENHMIIWYGTSYIYLLYFIIDQWQATRDELQVIGVDLQGTGGKI